MGLRPTDAHADVLLSATAVQTGEKVHGMDFSVGHLHDLFDMGMVDHLDILP